MRNSASAAIVTHLDPVTVIYTPHMLFQFSSVWSQFCGGNKQIEIDWFVLWTENDDTITVWRDWNLF